MDRVYGDRFDSSFEAQGDEWFTDVDSSGGVFSPPDADAHGWDGSIDHWYAGGCDGDGNNYHLVAAGDGQWYIDKFNKNMDSLIDRWPITDWPLDPTFATPTMEPNNQQRHLCVGGGRVVAIMNRYNPAAGSSGEDDEIWVAVFDTLGNYLQSWQLPMANHDFGGFILYDRLPTYTGCCTDGTRVYFTVGRVSDYDTVYYPSYNYSGEHFVSSVGLDTGDFQWEFHVPVVAAHIAATDSHMNGAPYTNTGSPLTQADHAVDLAVVDGDIIYVTGEAAIIRVTPDGDGVNATPVWWTPAFGDVSWAPASGGGYDESYYGITRAKGDTFWVSEGQYSTFHQFDLNGNHIQVLDHLTAWSMEPLQYLWTPWENLIQPPLRQKQRDDFFRTPRAKSPQSNRPTSAQSNPGRASYRKNVYV